MTRRAFSDSQPVLVATTQMLSRLNAALAHPVGMERFRANLVVDGGAEGWQVLRTLREPRNERRGRRERC